MAKDNLAYNQPTPRAAPNFNATSQRPSSEQTNGGYTYGLPTDFSGNTRVSTGNDLFNTNPGMFGFAGGAGANSSDPDARRAQALQNELDAAVRGANAGTDQGAVAAQLNALKARIGLKNSLGSAIAQNPDEEGSALNNQVSRANMSLASGLKNTRQNYNSRGLLFSGLREGGEESLKSGVASSLASNIAGTKRDYENTNEARKQAYASVDFAQSQQDLEMANQAFQITTKNNIARSQAYEQFGQGVGGLIGTAAAYNQRPQQPQQTQTSQQVYDAYQSLPSSQEQQYYARLNRL